MKAENFYDLAVENLKVLDVAQKHHRESHRDLWKTLIGVHSVVLGISGGLMAYSGMQPSNFLIASWICVASALLLGFSVLKIDIDQELDHELKYYQFLHNLHVLSQRKEAGEFAQDSARWEGLIIATFVEFIPDRLVWTPMAKEMHTKYKSELPGSKHASRPRRSGVNRFMFRAYPSIAQGFYLVSLLGLTMLVLSVILN